MTTRPIVDAGPALNFFAAGHERLFFACMGGVSVPETVRDEVLGKAARDSRFQHAQRVVSKLPEQLWQVLPDTVTSDLDQVIVRLERMPMTQRLRTRRDLGETMVIAHAVAAAQKGQEVWILIDEIRGTQVASAEKRRLERLRHGDSSVGALKIMSTEQVLEAAVPRGLIENRGSMRKIYGQLRSLDDGLPPIESTGLLTRELWRRSPPA
ncbi:hypothetical protein AABM36_01220 [Kocuria sp. KSNUG]|uniref:hypothetical protein n=1 Tax=Kocuria sp. KSNUG TaxID=3136676 RepID=UPI003C2E0EED